MLVGVIINSSGCGRRGDSIIGAWSSYDDYEYGSEHAEYFKDKTCFLDGDGMRIVGTWLKVEGNRYKITFPCSDGTSTMIFVTIIDDYLALEPDHIEQSRLVRDGTSSAKEIQNNINKHVSDLEEARRLLDVRKAAKEKEIQEYHAATNQEPNVRLPLTKKPYNYKLGY